MFRFSRTTTQMTLLMTLFVLTGTDRISADEAAPATPFGQMVHRLNPANWKMPSFQGLLPQTQEKARIKKKKESLVDEVGKTASSSWNRTKETFNPQKLNPANFFPAAARTPAKSAPAAKKPGFFQSWFSPSVPQDEHDTMSGFLKQDRPAP